MTDRKLCFYCSDSPDSCPFHGEREPESEIVLSHRSDAHWSVVGVLREPCERCGGRVFKRLDGKAFCLSCRAGLYNA